MNYSWIAFWLCVAVFVWCDHEIYLAGNNSFFWQYRTQAELELQKAIIAERDKGVRP